MRDKGNFGFDEETCFRLLDLGEYKRAITLGRQLVSRNPKSFDAHLCLARGYYRTGDYRKTLEHAKKMEKLASDKEELALAYGLIGLAYSSLGELELALMYHNKELVLCKELKNKEGEALALNNIAFVYEMRRDYEKALEFYRMSLKLRVYSVDRAATLNNIGNLYAKLGNYKEAVKYLKKAIDTAEKENNYHGAGRAMLNLGDIYVDMERYEEAERFILEGLRRMQVVGDEHWEIFGYTCLGRYYIAKGEYANALELFYGALAIAVQRGYTNEAHEVALHLALILELEPELKKNLDKEVVKTIEKFKDIEDLRKELAKYQKPQKEETSSDKKLEASSDKKPKTSKGKQKGKK